MIKQIILVLLYLSSFASATTYYVDAATGNDSNNGSSGSPWLTLGRAVPQYAGSPSVGPGDTIYVKNGTYAGITINHVPTVEGTSWEDIITYQNYVGHSPQISSAIGACITISGDYRRYLDFNGIDMEVTAAELNNVVSISNSGYIKIRNCKLDGYWDPNIGGEGDGSAWVNTTSAGIYFSGGTTLKSNDLIFNTLEITEVDRGITTVGYFGTGFQVLNCEIHKVAASPVSITYNANPDHGEILIQGNKFYDQEPKWDLATQTTIKWSHGSIVGQNSHMTYRNNIIHSSCDSGVIMFYSNPAIDTDGGYHDILIENNLLYDTISNQLIKMYHVGDGSIVIRNNTLIGSHEGITSNYWDYYGGATFSVISITSGCTGAGLQFDNNVVVGCVSIKAGLTGMTTHGNVIYSFADFNTSPEHEWDETDIWYLDAGVSQHSVNTAFITNFFAGVNSQDYFMHGTDYVRYPPSPTGGGPTFADYDDNFELDPNSPAIDHAVLAYSTSTDIFGNARGSSPDAGCYEYGAVGEANVEPVANTGGDQSVTILEGNNSVNVALSGTGSSYSNDTQLHAEVPEEYFPIYITWIFGLN